MEGDGRARLRRELQGLRADLRIIGDALVEALDRDGFEPTHARHVAPGSWLLRVKAPSDVQEAFGLAPEILLLAVDDEVQARDLHRAADEVVRAGLRLDSNLVIVADGHPSTLVARLERFPGHGQRVGWVWRDGEPFPNLTEALRERLPTYDVFDDRDPVRGNQLMGRDEEVAELKTRIARGDAVGVFGLRKMGKTSLVRAVTDWLDPVSAMKHDPGGSIGKAGPPPNPQARVLWMDAETLAPSATADDVADELLAALRRRDRAAGVSGGSSTRGGTAGLKATCEALLEKGERLCFVVDEYDLLFAREGKPTPVAGLAYVFRLVRAWGQQHQGFVSLILIGRDPEHLNVPSLDGVSNPLLAWFKPMWLGPLAAERADQLLRRLGRRVGLDVGDGTAELAYQWTGGHPMLHRQFGSALLQEVRREQRGRQAFGVQTDPHMEKAADRFIEREHVHVVDREIFELLRRRYPLAYSLILDLAGTEGSNGPSPDRGTNRPEARKILENFGILDDAARPLPLHLVWYARNLLPTERRSSPRRRRRGRTSAHGRGMAGGV